MTDHEPLIYKIAFRYPETEDRYAGFKIIECDGVLGSYTPGGLWGVRFEPDLDSCPEDITNLGNVEIESGSYVTCVEMAGDLYCCVYGMGA
jgi:hypothetical protein